MNNYFVEQYESYKVAERTYNWMLRNKAFVNVKKSIDLWGGDRSPWVDNVLNQNIMLQNAMRQNVRDRLIHGAIARYYHEEAVKEFKEQQAGMATYDGSKLLITKEENEES